MAPRGAPWWMPTLSTMPACPVKTTRLRMSLTRTPGRDRMDRLGVCLALALLGGLVVGACQAPAAGPAAKSPAAPAAPAGPPTSAPAALAPPVAPLTQPLKGRRGGQPTPTAPAPFAALHPRHLHHEGTHPD